MFTQRDTLRPFPRILILRFQLVTVLDNVKTPEHPALVLRPSYFPEKVGVNRKYSKNKNKDFNKCK